MTEAFKRHRGNPLARLHDRYEVHPDGCWVWIARRNSKGYGEFRLNGVQTRAHRAAWLLLRGPLEPGLELDHLCRRRECVNPDHLEPVTHRVNMSRGAWATATHCRNGHEFTPENTRVETRADGSHYRRTCIECCRERGRESWRRRNGYYVKDNAQGEPTRAFLRKTVKEVSE